MNISKQPETNGFKSENITGMGFINDAEIIARRPRGSAGLERVLLKRSGEGYVHPYVVATISPESLKFNEWFWGRYFVDFDRAKAYFLNPE